MLSLSERSWTQFVSIVVSSVVAVTVLMAAPAEASHTEGDLDPTFGDDGRVTTDLGGVATAWDVALQSDGKIVVGGDHDDDFGLVRYHSDGTLDSSFGSNGRVTISPADYTHIVALAVQEDDKILAIGSGGPGFIIARLRTDGSLDSTFGVNGIVRTDFTSIGGAPGAAGDIIVQPDGKIVAAGGFRDPGRFFLARYQTDGDLDHSFGEGGLVVTDVNWFGKATVLALQDDRKIVAAGQGNGADTVVARYHPDGRIDTSFGAGTPFLQDGAVAVEFVASGHSWPEGVVIQEDGKLVLGGRTNVPGENTELVALARFLPIGHLDPDFHGDGLVTARYSDGYNGRASGLAIQPDGKLIAGGRAYNESDLYDRRFGVARFLPDGTLDPAFGASGGVTTTFSGGVDAESMILQPDGRIIVIGSSEGDFAVARYLGAIRGNFFDDDNSTFESDIDWLASEGITKGCDLHQFCPDDFVTRGQMAAFLVRALGYADDGGGDLFVDDDASTFENDIDKLGTAGVTKGCNPPDNTEFCPDDFVTRGQMAAFLHRALGS